MVRSRGSEAPASMRGAPAVRRVATARGAALAVGRSPVVWVLLLAGLFDGLSDNWVHAALLWAAAVAVGWDLGREAQGRPAPPAVPLRPDPGPFDARYVVVVAAVVLGYGVVVGALTRYTWPVTVAVLVPGVLVLAFGWRGPLRPRPIPPPTRRRGAVLWAAVFVTAGVWELAALLQQPTLHDDSYDHPTISVLMDTVLASHAGRSITLLAWLAFGWFLLARIPGGVPARTRADQAGEPT